MQTTEDTDEEDDETFTVTLSDMSANAQLASDPTVKGTITDLSTLSVADASVSEASGIAEFVVTMSRTSEETVTVDYSASAD